MEEERAGDLVVDGVDDLAEGVLGIAEKLGDVVVVGSEGGFWLAAQSVEGRRGTEVEELPFGCLVSLCDFGEEPVAEVSKIDVCV